MKQVDKPAKIADMSSTPTKICKSAKIAGWNKK